MTEQLQPLSIEWLVYSLKVLWLLRERPELVVVVVTEPANK